MWNPSRFPKPTTVVLKEGLSQYPKLTMDLQRLYDDFQENSSIHFVYETKVYSGKIFSWKINEQRNDSK
jgi:hypothetical protein